ncbi:MAG: hypothetical protein K0R11_1456, partial [Acidimicrobiales bacterium]|nr:hypothetical protein [Acidimicrobiales bacterium]
PGHRPPGRRPGGRRRGPGAAGRRARRPQGQPLHPRHPHHLRLPHPRGLAPALRRHGRRPPAPGRRRRRGEDQPRRVRHGLLDRALRLRAHPQPPRPLPGPGGVERGERRRRGRRLRRPRPRVRHRRLGPPAGRLLRRGRGQADLRPGEPLRAHRLRLVARPDRPVRHHGGRRRRPPRGHRRPRPHGLDVAPGARPRAGAPARRGRRGAACGSRHRAARRGHRPRRAPAGHRGGRRPQRRRSQGRRRVRAGGHLRAVGLLPDRPGRGVQQPGPLRRGPLRPPGRRPHHAGDERGHPVGGLRGRGEAADHARDLRPVGRLLRRLLRQGAVRAHADDPRLRGRLPLLRRAAGADGALDRLPPRRQDGRPARHVPHRRVHHPVQPGRPPRRLGAVSATSPTRTCARSASGCQARCRC